MCLLRAAPQKFWVKGLLSSRAVPLTGPQVPSPGLRPGTLVPSPLQSQPLAGTQVPSPGLRPGTQVPSPGQSRPSAGDSTPQSPSVAAFGGSVPSPGADCVCLGRGSRIAKRVRATPKHSNNTCSYAADLYAMKIPEIWEIFLT